MIFFRRKKRREAEMAARDRQVEEIQRRTIRKIKEVTESTDRLGTLLSRDDVTYRLFLATRGHRR